MNRFLTCLTFALAAGNAGVQAPAGGFVGVELRSEMDVDSVRLVQ